MGAGEKKITSEYNIDRVHDNQRQTFSARMQQIADDVLRNGLLVTDLHMPAVRRMR